MTVTILYSGGLDSLIMKHMADVSCLSVNCVFFDIGQPYVAKELASLPSYVEVRKIDWLSHTTSLKSKGNDSGDIYIPGRNLTLTCLAASIFTPNEIWLGALLGETHDSATDKNQKFLDNTNLALSYVFSPFTDNIKVRFPLAESGFNKLTAVKWALDTGLSKEAIISTSSCLSGESGNCGACVVCARRWGIFGQLGLSEKYNRDPMTVSSNLRMFIEMLKPDSYYDNHRKLEIIPWVYHVLGTSDVNTVAKKLTTLLVACET